MESKITPEKLEQFLVQVMRIQKRYAHELRNVKTDRRSELIELINNFSSRELEER